jgi:predicted  nucleic acid-binding Zn-ribbon protein
MADDEKVFDNSWEAVWKRELNEISDKLKNTEKYSSSEIAHLQARKKELEETIEKHKSKKKDLTGGFAKGQQNIQNMQNMQMAQMMAGQEM